MVPTMQKTRMTPGSRWAKFLRLISSLNWMAGMVVIEMWIDRLEQRPNQSGGFLCSLVDLRRFVSKRREAASLVIERVWRVAGYPRSGIWVVEW